MLTLQQEVRLPEVGLEHYASAPLFFNLNIGDKMQPRSEGQKKYLRAMHHNKIVFAIGKPGTGKSAIAINCGVQMLSEKKVDKLVLMRPAVTAFEDLGHLPGPQPLDCKILTPTGWITMGEIQVGDKVIGRDGQAYNVIGVYDKGVQDIYEIETSRGGKTKTSGNHVWLTRNYSEKKHNKPWQIRSTLELKETLYNPNTGPRLNHFLPQHNVVQFEEQELPIPPYVMGVLLGDGSCSDSVSFSSEDQEIVDRVRDELQPYGLSLTKHGINYTIRGDYYNNKVGRPVKITILETEKVVIYDTIGHALQHLDIKRPTLSSRCENKSIIDGVQYEFLPKQQRWTNYIKNALYELGLERANAYTKFMPDIYKYNSTENRIALLQGLMDTDGTIKESTAEQAYTTTSQQLASDLVELIRSLGRHAKYYTRDRVGEESVYQGRKIVTRHISYEISVPKFENICPFHLSRKAQYVRLSAKGMEANKFSNISYVGQAACRCIKVDNADSLYITDDYIVTHNTIEEKMDPYLKPLFDELSKYYNHGQLDGMIKDGIIEIVPFAFVQGRTFNDAFIIIDEASNATYDQLLMALTRFGKNSKMVCCGDPAQSVLNPKYQDDFVHMAEDLETVKDIAVIHLNCDDIQRDKVVVDILHEIGDDYE